MPFRTNSVLRGLSATLKSWHEERERNAAGSINTRYRQRAFRTVTAVFATWGCAPESLPAFRMRLACGFSADGSMAVATSALLACMTVGQWGRVDDAMAGDQCAD